MTFANTHWSQQRWLHFSEPLVALPPLSFCLCTKLNARGTAASVLGILGSPQ